MARPRTPTSQLDASGAFDHDPQRARERQNEPIPPGPLGEPPARWRTNTGDENRDRLNSLQVEAWHELELQVAPNVLTISDRVAVEVYCSLIARHRAGEILTAAEYGLIKSFLAEMGMTPASRSRLNVPRKPEKPKNKFASLDAATNVQ